MNGVTKNKSETHEKCCTKVLWANVLLRLYYGCGNNAACCVWLTRCAVTASNPSDDAMCGFHKSAPLLSYYVKFNSSFSENLGTKTKENIENRRAPHNLAGAIAIINRTHDGPKNPYMPLFLRTILGPDYYVPLTTNVLLTCCPPRPPLPPFLFCTMNRYDARLFNQSAGMDAGFGAEDGYGVYSKPMFNRGDAQSVYRPKKDDGDAWGDADQQVGVVFSVCVFFLVSVFSFVLWRMCGGN